MKIEERGRANQLPSYFKPWKITILAGTRIVSSHRTEKERDELLKEMLETSMGLTDYCAAYMITADDCDPLQLDENISK